MSWKADDIPSLEGKVAMVTGANSGLGLASARALSAAGAEVLMACRSPERATEAAEDIRNGQPEAKISVIALDLADLGSIQRCSEEARDRLDRLDILMNNAGIMAIPQRKTKDGFEMQFGVNHLGHFALTGRLLPLLLDTEDSRIVNVSSNAHKFGRMRWKDLHHSRGYSPWPVYGQSKLSNLLFSLGLDIRLRESRAKCLVATGHPGYASTNLVFAAPKMKGSALMETLGAWSNRYFAQDAATGALPQLYAAAGPDVAGNDYFGPDGFMEVWGGPRQVGRTKAAMDTEAAERLWEISEELTGVRYAFP
jgi:NAD(P)-dependent dehydrogenase (short-subunit alcohol dehydrogenase family)